MSERIDESADAEQLQRKLDDELRGTPEHLRLVFRQFDELLESFGTDVERSVGKGIVYVRSGHGFASVRPQQRHLLVYASIAREAVTEWDDSFMQVSLNRRYPGTQLRLESQAHLERSIPTLRQAYRSA